MRILSLIVFASILCFFCGSALAAGNLTVYIWSEYIDPAIIRDFEKQFKVKVRLDYYESNEEMLIKLDKGGGLGNYDIIVPSTYIIPSLKNLKLLQALDHAQIPNIKNLEVDFTKMAVDPGNEYTIPYQWGTSGIIVRTKNPAEIKASWDILFNPKAETGGFLLFDTARDCIGSALKYLGYSINSTNPREVEEAAHLLIATKKRKNFLGFDGGVGGLNKVMSGFAGAAQVYSGEAIRAKEEDPDVHYLLPQEGGEIWTDLIAIPRNAPNAENAYLFINYLLDAEVGAKLARYNRYATPNAASKAFIPEEELNNPALYPKLEGNNKFEYIIDLGPNNRLYDEAWTIIKTK